MVFALENDSTIRKALPGAVVGIGASKTAVVTIPVGPTYEAIGLQLLISETAPTRAEIESMLTNFRLSLSGEEIFNLSGLELVAWAEFYNAGITNATGYIHIPFTRPWMKRIESVMGPAFGTQGETSFTLEITQDATSTIDGIVAMADINPIPQVLGTHYRLQRLFPGLPGAGRTQWSGIKPRREDKLSALHFRVSTAADLTDFSLIGDGIRLIDTVTQAQLAFDYRKYTPARTLQTAKKVISIDLCADGEDRPIPMTMNDFTVEFNFANAPTVLAVIAEFGTTRQTQAGLQYAAQLQAQKR